MSYCISTKHNIGFVSTRFSTTDGVSLETSKWARVLEGLGQQCFYFAGECDRPAGVSYVVSEAHFNHPEINAITEIAYSQSTRPKGMTGRIHALRKYLKAHLYAFIKQFDIDLLIVENALSIPMNIPLGLAITELIAETGLPVIAHHHDFYWERKRYLSNCIGDYLEMAFPPRLPDIQHVVINSLAAAQIARRCGVSARIIPNVMDFDHPPAPPDEYAAGLRADLGLVSDEYFLLQPTRVVRRKGIEHAVELVRRLGLPARLVISHNSGDEGDEYKLHIDQFAELLQASVIYAGEVVAPQRGQTADGRKVYALEDVYPFADLVTYPSLLEGFGNAFLEAVYFRRPVLVNNYTIYAIDIKPKGFRAIEFDGFITNETVEKVRQVLTDTSGMVAEMTEQNYQLARRYYSFGLLERQLCALLQIFFGEER